MKSDMLFVLLYSLSVKMRAFIALLFVAAVSAKAPLLRSSEAVPGKYIVKVKVRKYAIYPQLETNLCSPARAVLPVAEKQGKRKENVMKPIIAFYSSQYPI